MIPIAGLGAFLTKPPREGIGDSEELIVFVPSPIIVAGEGTEEGEKNQNVTHDREDVGDGGVFEESTKNPADQTQRQQEQVKLVVAVAAIHQFPKKIAHEKNSLQNAKKSLD